MNTRLMVARWQKGENVNLDSSKKGRGLLSCLSLHVPLRSALRKVIHTNHAAPLCTCYSMSYHGTLDVQLQWSKVVKLGKVPVAQPTVQALQIGVILGGVSAGHRLKPIHILWVGLCWSQ
jgi:hypothetical protein